MRASLKSNVEKNLDQSRVVILDSMNYIKGYRYELYCLARNSMTTLCLVYCDTSKDIARQWCEQMQLEEAKGDQEASVFPIDLFDDYASRMEFPNPAKRWDQPLFHLRADEPIPFDEIHAAISDTAKNKPKDPVSTKPEQQFDENFIQELDKRCQEIVNYVVQKQQEFGIGDSLGIPDCNLKYRILRIMSPVELKKLKKDFVKFCR